MPVKKVLKKVVKKKAAKVNMKEFQQKGFKKPAGFKNPLTK